MESVVIVGSGASGAQFALSLLKKNYRVTMLDVGHSPRDVVEPELNVQQLKANLPDPAAYFLGPRFQSVIFSDSEGEYYGFPESKRYVFSSVSPFAFAAEGFHPLYSFARGGLAEAWTGGVYPFNGRDLRDFPFSYDDIAPFYDAIASQIGISGTIDDMAKFFPVHGNLEEPLRLDAHSREILKKYEENKSHINNKLHSSLGRSRIAVLSRDLSDRKACSYSGRCLWGCPSDSLYTPSITLRECRKHGNFEYVPGVYAKYFNYRSERIESVVVESIADASSRTIPVERLALAAGTLSTSKIFLESIWQHEREIAVLHGLMDNRQVLIPFINLNLIGKEYEPDEYQYHLLALGIETTNPDQYLHGLITTLKAALAHPIIGNIPLNLRAAISVFRNVRAGLGLINLNFPDQRRDENSVTLQRDAGTKNNKLVIRYAAPENEKLYLKRGVKLVKKIMRKTGCFVAPGTVHVRPMGASVHYAGTLPMSREKIVFGTNEFGKSWDFDNLYVVDGSTFPSLPSKNLTFTLMANAIRIAHHEF